MVDQAPEPRYAGLGRRLIAMIYDSFLLIALFFVISIPIVLQVGEQTLTHDPLVRLLYRLVLLLTAFLFFGWFWTHGGQTLGMRAWRLRTMKVNGSPMDWPTSALRFIASVISLACFGLGFLWIVIDPQRLTWHDRLSRSRVIVEPKKVKSKQAS